MEIIRVQNKKWGLILAIFGLLFFGSMYYFLITSEDITEDITSFIIYTLCVGPFLALCFYVLLEYFRKKLIIYTDHITFTPVIGRKRTFYYHDIGTVKIIPFPYGEDYKIISRDGKKLASFESNMTGSQDALEYLTSKNRHLKQSRFILAPSPESKRREEEKEKRKEERQLKEHQERLAFIMSKWSLETIAREKKAVNFFRFLSGTLCIISLFLPFRPSAAINISILLFYWCLYLWFYPKMIFGYEKKLEGSAYFLPYPFILCSVSVLILMSRFDFINSEEKDCFLFFFCFAILLLFSYGLVLFIRKRREHWSNIGITLAIIFAISFSSTEPLNWLMTFGEQEHYAVSITYKWYEDSVYSHFFHHSYYYLEVIQGDRYLDFQISRQLYQSVSLHEQVYICYRKSIFGFPYYILHKPTENPKE